MIEGRGNLLGGDMDIREKRRTVTLEEYHRMAEAGILHEDDRVELVEGEIIETSPIGVRAPGGAAEGSVDALFEARDLLSQLFYLLFEVPLPAPDAGVAGFKDEADAVRRADGGAGDETCRAAEPTQGRLPDRAGRGGGGEEAGGEAGHGPEGRPEEKFRRTFAHSKSTPLYAYERTLFDRASVA